MSSKNKIEVCQWWIERGFRLVLCQPGRKYLVHGWGEHETKFQIKTIEEAQHYYAGTKLKFNLAVLGGEEKIILDFDDRDLYKQWADEHAQLAGTYTEQSPRGVHVFFYGSAPSGITLRAGVELKKICLVAPSVVFGQPYIRGEAEILHADPGKIFSSLSKVGTPTVYRLQADAARRDHHRAAGPIGLIEQIKSSWSIEQIFLLYRPAAQLQGRGRYRQTLCPFHDDHKPSFFLDTEKQLFGCHRCGVRGDVINLYARFQGITVQQAISRMAYGVKS